MSDYTQITFFAPKDALLSGDPDKVIKGSELDPELAAISSAVQSKLDVSNDTATNLTVQSGFTVSSGDVSFAEDLDVVGNATADRVVGTTGNAYQTPGGGGTNGQIVLDPNSTNRTLKLSTESNSVRYDAMYTNAGTLGIDHEFAFGGDVRAVFDAGGNFVFAGDGNPDAVTTAASPPGTFTIQDSNAILALLASSANSSRIYFQDATNGAWGAISAVQADGIAIAPGSGTGDDRYGGMNVSTTLVTIGGTFQTTSLTANGYVESSNGSGDGVTLQNTSLQFARTSGAGVYIDSMTPGNALYFRMSSSPSGDRDVQAMRILEDGDVEIGWDGTGSGVLRLGDNDASYGELLLFGDGAASTQGGALRLYMAADHDTVSDYWETEVSEDDYYIREGTVARYRITGADGLHTWWDEAGAGVFQINTSIASFGDASTGEIFSLGVNAASNTGLLYLSGSTNSFSHPQVQLFGSGHAGQAGDIKMNDATGTKSVFHWDDSVARLYLASDDGTVYIGSNDTVRGDLSIYGDATNGGVIYLYNSAADDTLVDYWQIHSDNGALRIREDAVVRHYIAQQGNFYWNDASGTTLMTLSTANVLTLDGTQPQIVVKGGSGGATLAHFERDQGSTGTVLINASGGDPALIFENASLNKWAVGKQAGTNTIDIGYGAGNMDGSTVVASFGQTTVEFPVGSVYVGEDDTTQGNLYLYGNGTGSQQGGRIRLYTAADYDTTYNYYNIEVFGEDLYIGNSVANIFFHDASANYNYFYDSMQVSQFMDVYGSGAGKSSVYVRNSEGGAELRADGDELYLIQTTAGAAEEDYWIRCNNNAGVYVYYNNVSELHTLQHNASYTTSGVEVKDHGGTWREVGFNVMPVVEADASQTFDEDDCSKMIHRDGTANVTYTLASGTSGAVPPVGATIMITNENATGTVTISAAGTLRWFAGTGTPSTGNRTLAEGGVCTVYKYSSTEWWIWGNGLS